MASIKIAQKNHGHMRINTYDCYIISGFDSNMTTLSCVGFYIEDAYFDFNTNRWGISNDSFRSY